MNKKGLMDLFAILKFNCTMYLALGLEMIKERTSKNVLNSNHLITSVSRKIKDKIESMMYLYIILSFQRIIQGDA